MTPTTELEGILPARQSKYGPFVTQAELAQLLKEGMRTAPQWARLEPYKKECLDMVAHKISRILNGDSNYLDSWVDIVGYTTRVIESIKTEKSDDAPSAKQDTPVSPSTSATTPLTRPSPLRAWYP